MRRILPKLMNVLDWNKEDKTIVLAVIIMSIINLSIVLITK
ncbi:hypothetical protein [Sulfurovum sp.]